MKILVVEDDPLVRIVVVEALLDAGYAVLEAENGAEALEQLKHAPDVLFTDIRLPGTLTGWDIAERCRENHRQIPVIYVTGYSPVLRRPVPGSLFFQKPYTPEQILTAIRNLTV
jgi:CheY-like chemotaxis protein